MPVPYGAFGSKQFKSYETCKESYSSYSDWKSAFTVPGKGIEGGIEPR